MAYDDKEMLRDYNGVVIPTQFYNPSTGEFELDSSISATAAIVATLATESTLTATAASLDIIKAIDFAKESTLTATAASLDTIKAIDFAKESTLTATAASLDTIKAIDFATETTLATLATEAKLEAARALLETISGLNFAEETTQAAIETAIGATTDADTELTVIGRLKKILATLEAGISVTESTPLTSIATTVADGDDVALGSTSDTDANTTVIGRLQKLITDLAALADSKKLSDIVTSLGYLSGISAAGAVGTLTATTTATAAIAGVSALTDRKGLEILNNSANIVYWGYSNSVTTADGIPINPGIAKQFQFNPSVATPIYVIAASDSELYIHEWK